MSPQTSNESPTRSTDEVKDLNWLRNNRRKFEELTGDEKRKILGNLMYYRIEELGTVQKELVPKITGMLIDLEVLDLSEIIDILENDPSLLERVKDAIAVISEADN